MDAYARIDRDSVTIDTTAWLRRRTTSQLSDLTGDLHAFGARSAERLHHVDPPFVLSNPADPWPDVVLAWCRDRGHTHPNPGLGDPHLQDPGEPDAGPMVLRHEDTRLDTSVWIARAVAPGVGAIAVVMMRFQMPLVYGDATTDGTEWYDADSVAINCPGGHSWTWRTGRELLTSAGKATTIARVFGPDLNAPFTCCPTCTAIEQGHHPGPCRCEGSSLILCPVCGARCDVGPPSR